MGKVVVALVVAATVASAAGVAREAAPPLARAAFPASAGTGVVLLSTRDGHILSRFRPMDGSVAAIVSDGRGGWFVGGGFRTIAGIARPGLARVTADGRVDRRWRPRATATSLVRIHGTLYGIGSERIVALDARTGGRLRAPVVPNPGSLAAAGTVLYVAEGGPSGGALKRIYALDSGTGRRIARWELRGLRVEVVTALAASGSRLYIAGVFRAKKPWVGIAAVDRRSGRAVPWRSRVAFTDAPRALLIVDKYVIAAGGEEGRGAVLDQRTGAATRLNRTIAARGTAASAFGRMLYVGGDWGHPIRPRNLGALAIRTGHRLSWHPIVAKEVYVYALSATRTRVLAGGSFLKTLG